MNVVVTVPGIEVVVNVDVVVTPAGVPPPTAAAAAATPKCAHHNAHAEADGRRGGDGSIRICHRRVRVYRRRAVDYYRVITGNINHLRVGRLDLDDGLRLNRLYLDLLLFRRLQLTGVLRLLPHPLDGIHYFALLIEESVAKILRPLNIRVQQFEQVGESHHSLHAGVPRLFGRGLGQVLTGEFRVLL